ncbi:PREDICTED: F-box/kelch-repeat protein At3g06240-like [Prunus mume]|uniref:F-box/kelch-repeat protein At3g06240-like n=1 Tax=Prunus mume TaxID=102107 RepID=A0ABM0PW87_PRUMU|nr:PREDICTED: F-box/kelch-repeat protein At3g06240-like [Prunus mume]
MSEEMVLHILSRLPSKSLMRFKCVRKSWYTVINNPMFVESHLSNSMHNKFSTCILFKRFVQSDTNTGEKELGFSFLYLCNDYNDNEHNVNSVVEDIKFTLSTGQYIGLEVIESLSIIAHCHGIVCLCDGSDNIVLCNPAIKELKLLPQSCLPQLIQCGVGFGYDPKSKDYKVHRISCDGEEIYGDRLVFFPPRVEIYTLNTDSWRQIKNNYLETEDTFFWPDYFQMYWKGICYWVGYEQPKEFESYFDRLEDEQKKTMIFLFDTGDEVFRNILLPDSLYEPPEYRYVMRILVWNESVALFGLDSFGTFDERYGLWVLDDFDGAKSSWTRNLTFDPMAGIKSILEFWKSDEIVMVTRNGDIVSYNPGTNKLKNLPMHFENPSLVETIVFVDTLVPVMGGNKLVDVDK